MRDFIIDFAIMAGLMFPLFFLTFAVLWRLRAKGWYTLLLGFFFQVVFLRAGFWVAPHAMLYHHGPGTSPVEMGISMGCGMPMVFMSTHHFAQRRKRQKSRRSATGG